MRAPLDWTERANAKPPVDLLALGIGNAGNNRWNPERVARNHRGDEVAVVAAGHRRKRIGTFDSGVVQRVTIKAYARNGAPAKARHQAAKGLRIFVHNRDVMPVCFQQLRQQCPDAPAPNNHRVHRVLPSIATLHRL
jgi:hypothetical protein